jgi:pyruvate-ferredoxin/flavodoxin oxidoreductase
MHLTNIAYLSAIRGRVPFINFFDGFRTSHEYNKVDVIDFDKVKKLIDQEALQKFRNRSLDIDNPTTRGTNQGDGIYFQVAESRNEFYENLPHIVNNYRKEINEITGRNYKPFNYYGAKDATNVIIAMGSVCDTIKETIDYLNTKGKKYGLIEVHLYRPFNSE